MLKTVLVSFVDNENSLADAGVVTALAGQVDRLRHSAVIDRFVLIAPEPPAGLPPDVDCVVPSTWDSGLPGSAGIVAVLDLRGPLAPIDQVVAVVGAVRSGAEIAVTATAVTDTIKLRTPDGLLESTVDRSWLREVRSPWACRRGLLAGPVPSDRAAFTALPWSLGRPVTPVEPEQAAAAPAGRS